MIRLRGLLPDWDGEGAPVPSEDSINRAEDIIDLTQEDACSSILNFRSG